MAVCSILAKQRVPSRGCDFQQRRTLKRKMSSTRVAEDDLRHAFKFVRPLLTILGAWPISLNSPAYLRILQRSLASLCLFLQLFVIGPGILYVVMQEKNSRRRVKLASPFMNAVGQLIKHTILLRRTSQLRRVLSGMRKDWLNSTEEDKKVFRRKARIGHKMVLIVAVTMYGGGLCYRTLLPLLRGKIVLPNNTTIRLLPCPSYFVLFNEQFSPYYEIIFALQIIGGFVSYTVLCGSIGVCATLCLHTCSLLRILIGKMTVLTDKGNHSEKIVQEKIVDVVEYQTKIKRFLSNVEPITQYLCFSEILGDTCTTCMLGYCIIMEWENHNVAALAVYFVLLTTYVSTNFIICYVGQLLIDESNDLGRTSRTLSWYRFPTKKARCLVLMIIMSNYPVKLTAGKVVEISLATFTDIMKASIGYLNMLRELI